MAKQSDAACHDNLVMKLVVARRQVQSLSDEIRKKTGMTGTQCIVLTVLLQSPGVSQTSLVKVTGIDRSTLADVVRRLVERGWVARKRLKEDTRTYAVTLTSEGHEKALKISKTE